MLNLKTDIPIKTDVIEAVQVQLAQIREMTLEVEQILKLALADNIYYTREETAKMLRCDGKKIPSKIPRFRVGNQYLFDLKDINDFIAQKKR